jgi:hypothetical protein
MSHQRVLTLYPYLLDGTCWVFDDERTGLKEEAFVLGMTEMISRAVDGKGIHGKWGRERISFRWPRPGLDARAITIAARKSAPVPIFSARNPAGRPLTRN